MDDLLTRIRTLVRSRDRDDSAVREALKDLISEADSRSHEGRIERLRFLLLREDLDPFAVDALAFEYYQEARLCWYVGAFVASIMMAQLAFEELLRSHFRVARGGAGKLRKGKTVDKSTFADLIDEAEIEGVLSKELADALHKLRKDYRNPYAHTRDLNTNEESSGSWFMRQLWKIEVARTSGGGLEEEAKSSIELLTVEFPRICKRIWHGRLKY